MIPDPGALVLLIAVGLMGWAVFRMCTCRDMTDIDDAGESDRNRRAEWDEARRRKI